MKSWQLLLFSVIIIFSTDIGQLKQLCVCVCVCVCIRVCMYVCVCFGALCTVIPWYHAIIDYVTSYLIISYPISCYLDMIKSHAMLCHAVNKVLIDVSTVKPIAYCQLLCPATPLVKKIPLPYELRLPHNSPIIIRLYG